MASIYDHPLYYDILFGWDRRSETGFHTEALLRHGAPRGGRILEVACGTGQIALRLAALGWRPTGLDHSPEMLAFLRARAAESGAAVETICADMTAFELAELQDGACNPLSSFRFLRDDAAAVSHLDATARALRPGSPYVIDTAFGTSGAGADVDEEWSMQRGAIEVRAERSRILVRDGEPGAELELDWGADLRAYTPEAFARVVETSRHFSIAACYPEAGIGPDGTSQFDLRRPLPRPSDGRALVVLTRDGAP